MILSETEVFDQLTEHRGGPPPGTAFGKAIDLNVVAEYQQGEIEIDDLSAKIDEIIAIRRPRQTSEEGQNPKPDFRRSALNEIFALEAAELSYVRNFRTDHLKGKLVPFGRVASWVGKQQDRDGPPTVFARIPIGPKERTINLKSAQARPGYKEEPELLLEFVAKGESWRQSVPVAVEGTLYQLRAIGEQLHGRYGWSTAWAATWVLTGRTPPPTWAHWQKNTHWQKNDPWPWPGARRSVSLEVPVDVTPAEVGQLYRQLRNELMESEPKPRSVGKKKADLAVFAYARRSGHSWLETMQAWNKQKDNQTYKSKEQFTRDCRDGFKRITGSDLEWQGKGVEEDK